MKLSSIAIFTTLIAGCGSIQPPLCPGTRSYDVQLCRGERIYQIPNPPYMALQRQSKCNACIDIQNNCYHGVPNHCQPKWEQR